MDWSPSLREPQGAEWRATNLFLSANKKPNYYSAGLGGEFREGEVNELIYHARQSCGRSSVYVCVCVCVCVVCVFVSVCVCVCIILSSLRKGCYVGVPVVDGTPARSLPEGKAR